ncbi:DUF881 domain-containing protein [Scrofimicrobium sp. R131]|uniref:DUF881 domain-containing protein n=1 Tax=Scrofimicrobium appendicitidis TaxID=3079930 RepID=A0AAU7V4X2_9ACTO
MSGSPEPPHPPRRSQPEEHRAGASMMLLQTILDSALDPGYRAAAERGPKKLPWWRALLVFLIVLALGVGTGIAIRAMRAESSARSATHEFLLDQVELRRDRIAEVDAGIDDLKNQVQERSSQQGTVTPVADGVALATALRPVSGPGVQVELSDGQSLVRDADMRAVVNRLWEAGAEAIAINGTRLGSNTTIRTAGSAILVDLQAVASPYMIEAVGDRDALLSAVTGGSVRSLVDRAGIGLSAQAASDLELGSAQLTRLNFVR